MNTSRTTASSSCKQVLDATGIWHKTISVGLLGELGEVGELGKLGAVTEGDVFITGMQKQIFCTVTHAQYQIMHVEEKKIILVEYITIAHLQASRNPTMFAMIFEKCAGDVNRCVRDSLEIYNTD